MASLDDPDREQDGRPDERPLVKLGTFDGVNWSPICRSSPFCTRKRPPPCRPDYTEQTQDRRKKSPSESRRGPPAPACRSLSGTTFRGPRSSTPWKIGTQGWKDSTNSSRSCPSQ